MGHSYIIVDELSEKPWRRQEFQKLNGGLRQDPVNVINAIELFEDTKNRTSNKPRQIQDGPKKLQLKNIFDNSKHYYRI